MPPQNPTRTKIQKGLQETFLNPTYNLVCNLERRIAESTGKRYFHKDIENELKSIVEFLRDQGYFQDYEDK